MSNDNEAILLQMRTAHRILVGYYQRLLPCIEKIARELDADFYYWGPKDNTFPRSNTNPFQRWQWDLLPAMNGRYLFKNIDDTSKTKSGDYVVEFLVINDDGYLSEHRNVEPDALSLNISVEKANSILRVGIYTALEDSGNNFYSLWEHLDYPKYSKDGNTIEINQQKGFAVGGVEIPIIKLVQEEGLAEVGKILQKLLDEEKMATHCK
ncbi:hypothetical protein [Vibrio rarus]|uniref:hypothetical protein n=1 Tax=Vibrio rarus TaxID=413403 RepID=UPI0021C43DBB|nr:hypothetical protein [Vibrio rarus]